jgi:hypothetical protein
MHGIRLLFVSALATACGSSLPLPRQVAATEDAFFEVPYPPPPALSELIPQRPKDKDAVFQDGGWTWRGSYYVWQRGGWVAPDASARFSPWAFHFTVDGRGLFSQSHWVDTRGNRLRPPAILVPAVTPPNEVTAEFQTGR